MKINRNVALLLKDTAYSISSNIFTMLVSVIITLLVPKFLGIEEYSYWQLYLFYSSYSGYFHLGWNDGFLLRYSGKEYKELDKINIKSQLVIEVAGMCILSFSLLMFYANLYQEKIFIIYAGFCLNIFLINIRYFILCVFQSTSRFKEYSIVIIIERLSFVLLLLIIYFSGTRDFKAIILADILGKAISLVIAFYWIRDLCFIKIKVGKKIISDILENIKVGIKLMISSLTSMLTLGIARFKIEKFWDIIVFGKISFCISITNLFITFVNAVGIIMFQKLFRIKKEHHILIYNLMKNALVYLMGVILFLFFPVYLFLHKWLPQYADSLIFISYLFPMCIFESKMVLLNAPYLKLYRLENNLLGINIAAVISSTIFSFLSVNILHNIPLTLLSITFISSLKCLISDYIIGKKLGFKLNSYQELIAAAIFLGSSSIKKIYLGFLIYCIFYFLFLFKNRTKILILKETIIQIFIKQ